MSKKLEKWKRITTTQVKLTGSISAITGLEMIEHITKLEWALRKIRDLELTHSNHNIAAVDAVSIAGKALDT